uniref:Aerolysin-like C-terminal domain-containing protein n=1 Tax=Oncorhynchus kisutch TaxID=8019 RepID=A0A8C7N3Q8_ONCKI
LNMATRLQLISGGGGSSFEFHGMDNGATIKKIGVAVEGWRVKAVRAELVDRRVATSGNSHTFNEFEFKLGERITKLSLWGNDVGTRLGAIKFTTSQNRQFFEKITSWPLKTEYTIDVGSGISQENSTDQTLTKTSSWSVSNKIESTLNMSVKVGIPYLLEVSSGFSLTVGVEQTTSLQKTETITESDTINVKIPPGKTMDVEITMVKANFDLDYRAIVKVTCMIGSQLFFPSTGVTYTSVRISTKET